MQEPDGTIRLKCRETPLEQNQPIITNKNHHNPRIEEIVMPWPSSPTSTSKLVGVNYAPPVPKPAYENTSSPPSSPTQSEVLGNYSQINTITKPFQINK